MAKQEPLVSIIILNYNFGDLLLKCVESIKNSNYTNYEIIVVDNASKDNNHPRLVTLIVNKIIAVKINNIPITTLPSATNVDGTEKYPDSLKIEITTPE